MTVSDGVTEGVTVVVGVFVGVGVGGNITSKTSTNNISLSLTVCVKSYCIVYGTDSPVNPLIKTLFK